MGKTIEKDSENSSFLDNHKEEEGFNIQLPISLARKEDIIDKIRGYNIAIYHEEIIAIDKSLRQLHKAIESVIPKGDRCEIEYIEEGASIYGSCF